MQAERARERLTSLATVGLDLPAFVDAALAVLRPALPFGSACVSTVDPATELLTGTIKSDGIDDDHDAEWAYHEYEADDLYDFRDVVHRPGGVTTLHTETGGDLSRSRLYTELYGPVYDFRDELRVALRTDGVTWGFCALHRDGAGGVFTPAEQEFASTVSRAFAQGLRTGIVAGNAAAAPVTDGPAVVVVDGAGSITMSTPAATARMADLGTSAGPEGVIPYCLRSVVAAARLAASGQVRSTPRIRLRTRSGHWVVAHAAPLAGAEGSVVVTIEDARPPEIVPLIVAGFGLTGRETDVVAQVLQGAGTAEIAAALHVSAYTVQDHLKSIFAKAGVRSRRELAAAVFYDHYAPRLGQGGLAPSGWFASG